MGQLQDRTLALAGIFQAARLVQQLSRDGRADPVPFDASLRSVLRVDAETAADVYGGVRGVAFGLRLLRDKLGGQAASEDIEIAKYAIAMIQLETALKRRPEVADAIRSGIDTVRSQMEFFEQSADASQRARLVEKLAELYTRTLSTLNPRIMVSGEQDYLADAHTAASIRAALFAGIRSAVLWRQMGGRRLQLLWSRGKSVEQARRLLEEIERP